MRRRQTVTFNLSFLDVMSCGFGAVILIFLIIDHANDVQKKGQNGESIAEVTLLQEEIVQAQEDLTEARNSQDLIDQQIVEMQGASERLIAEISQLEDEFADKDETSLARIAHVNKLKTELKTLENKLKRLRANDIQGRGNRSKFVKGDGERQYLTGLRLGGKRVLILLDVSASMLDRTIVNVIRLRNLPAETRKLSEKWQAAVGTVDWLSSQLAQNSRYQIYAFNTESWPLLKGTEGKWLSINNRQQLNSAIQELHQLVPEKGTSLESVFRDVASFINLPDNIILITDGLPTQGKKLKKGMVTGQQRLKYFNKALKVLPKNIPVNIILAPMEGDPMAAAAFWQLASSTRGSFMSPSKDWP